EEYGSYQFISIDDIINNFIISYVGEDKIISKIKRTDVQFHAMRGIQELNYDAFKEIKVLQLDVNEQLRFILPSDFVNWVRVSCYKNGYLYPLTENIQVG
mgnify:CR=1